MAFKVHRAPTGFNEKTKTWLYVAGSDIYMVSVKRRNGQPTTGVWFRPILTACKGSVQLPDYTNAIVINVKTMATSLSQITSFPSLFIMEACGFTHLCKINSSISTWRLSEALFKENITTDDGRSGTVTRSELIAS